VKLWRLGWRLWRYRPGLATVGTLAWIAFHAMPFFVGLVLRAVFDALSGNEPAGLNAYSLIAILAGGTVAGVGYVRAVRAEREARRQAEVVGDVSSFLIGLFGAAPGDRQLPQLSRLERPPHAAVISVGELERGDRIVAEDAILGDEDRGESLRVPEEQAVVADAQAEHDIEFAAVLVQELGLAHRVAQRFELPRPDLLAVGDAEILLGDAAGLACGGHHLEAVALEYAAQHVGVVDEADAIGDADPAVAHALGELHDLLDPRPLAVAL